MFVFILTAKDEYKSWTKVFSTLENAYTYVVQRIELPLEDDYSIIDMTPIKKVVEQLDSKASCYIINSGVQVSIEKVPVDPVPEEYSFSSPEEARKEETKICSLKNSSILDIIEYNYKKDMINRYFIDRELAAELGPAEHVPPEQSVD